MASISFSIKKDYLDKNSEAVVILQYSHDYKSFKHNTGIKVNPAYIAIRYNTDYEVWEFMALRPLKASEKQKLKAADEQLKSVFIGINQALLELRSKSLSLLPAYVRQHFLREPTLKAEVIGKSVMTWYQEYISLKEREIGSGINSYRSTFHHLESFTNGKGVLHFQELTRVFLESFRDYLLSLGLSGPTIHKQFKNFRFFLNWIVGQDEDGLIRVPMAYKKFQVKARYGNPVGLTIDQFFELCNTDLSKRPFLERTRDLFVFAVSIGGPRHGDLSRMSKMLKKGRCLLNNNTITYFEGKTGNAHQEIVLNKFGLDIFEKYNHSLPDVPANQRMNKNLKAIAELLKWNEPKQIPVYDAFGKLKTVQEIPLKEIFSTKFMRKTAATIDNMLGVPTKTSMKRTGHKTFAAYSRYVDVNRESLQEANKQWDNLKVREGTQSLMSIG